MIILNSIYKKHGEKEILKNISLTINSSEMTFIVGTSGVGKTTLLNIIGGLDKPTSGDVIFNGQNIQEDLSDYRAKNIGFVFQDSNLISGLSTIQNVEIATSFSGAKKDTESIRNEIVALGISDPDQKVETLSGGEKQRAAVVRSICKDASIIIADEPTGNLDSNNADLVLKLLKSLNKDRHVIVVSHDMEKARKYADRIITLSDGIFISDMILTSTQNTIISTKNDTTQNEKNNLKTHFFDAFITLGKNSVKLRKGKIISIALVIALAIISIAAVIQLNQSGNELSHNVNVNYLENDLINLYYGNGPNTGFMEMSFTTDEIQSIQSNYDIKEMVLTYQNVSNDWLFSTSTRTANAHIKQIDISDFFEDRVMTNEIEGQFITTNNEIIIGEDVAQQLFDENCIGEVILLNDGVGNSISLTIVGVNRTRNSFDETYSFVSAELIKELLQKKLTDAIFERQELFQYYTEVQGMTTGGLHGSMKEVETTEQLMYGKMPETSNQILISTGLLCNVLNEFGINNDYTKEQVFAGNISITDINRIFEKKLALNFNGLFAIYVSGIYLSEDLELRYTNELIQDLQEIDPISIDIYLSNPDEAIQIKDKINEDSAYEASTQLETLKANVSIQTRFFSLALVMVGLVLFFISIAMLSSFSKIAVLERKKEVAIMKSLGANNRSVLLILLFDSAVIAILSFFLAMIMFAVLKFVVPCFIPNINILISNFPFLLIASITLIFALLVFFQMGVGLRKMARKMPAELFSQ